MDDTRPVPEDAALGHGLGTLNIYLALYILAFAFFILLFSISNVETRKSRAVMESVTSAFAGLLPPTTEPTRFTSKEGEALGGQKFQDRVKGLFANYIPAARVEIVQPGREMRIAVRVEELFQTGAAQVTPDHGPLLERIASSLGERPPGLRFDMEFVIGVAATRDGALPVAETLELARAGALAREMTKLGAPADSIAVGLKPGAADEAALWFYVRPEGEIRLPFRGEDERARR